MLNILKKENMGRSEKGWLHSLFHFSFAEYYNPANIHFGMLRVVNDDVIEPGGGFGTHPHENMEIVSYVVDGVLTHKDSMGNQREVTRGQVQYMSAGTGVLHSEYNLTDTVARFLQIWILPDKEGHQPAYGDFPFSWEERINNWLHIVSGHKGNAPVTIHQDMDIYVTYLEAGKEQTYDIIEGRQVYMIQIEGNSLINQVEIGERDAVEITNEKQIALQAKTDSHFILFDMKA